MSNKPLPFLDELNPPARSPGELIMSGVEELSALILSPSCVWLMSSPDCNCSVQFIHICSLQSGFPPVETFSGTNHPWLPPCSHNADRLHHYTLFFCNVSHCTWKGRVGCAGNPPRLPVLQSSRLELCLTIQYCPSENIVQPVQTIVFNWCNLLKYTLVGYV